MRRFSFATAALTLIVSGIVDVSPARAVVCSEDVCISRCFIGGGKRCIKGCDMRIARRISSGVCPWLWSNWSPERQVALGGR